MGLVKGIDDGKEIVSGQSLVLHESFHQAARECSGLHHHALSTHDCRAAASLRDLCQRHRNRGNFAEVVEAPNRWPICRLLAGEKGDQCHVEIQQILRGDHACSLCPEHPLPTLESQNEGHEFCDRVRAIIECPCHI